MEVFRISSEKYSKKFTSSGSANRWNKKGQNVIYTGSSRSLSSLELVVHRSYIKPKDNYKVMVISIADDDNLFSTIKIDDLPSNWRSLGAYRKLQEIGSSWYSTKESLVLKVPSAVIPQEYNFVLNTDHDDFAGHIRLVRTEDYFWDDRLF